MQKSAAKVAAILNQLTTLAMEDAPASSLFPRTLDEGRLALLEMVSIPAHTVSACQIKLSLLTKMAPWYQEGDPDMLKCFMIFAEEAMRLLERQTAEKPDDNDQPADIFMSRSMRWFVSLATAVPSAFFAGPWDSG